MDDSLANSPGALEIVKKYWIHIVLGIFTVNILILNLFFFFPKSKSPQAIPSENKDLLSVSQDYCSQGCVDQINLTLKSQMASASSTTSPISSVSPAPTLTPTLTPTPTPTPAKTVKEFFVPLGVGTGNSADWTAVEGIGAEIDPSDYGDIKQITLELTAQIPTGNQTIWIRLYNANTYQSVTGSEMTLSGGAITLLKSSPISLSSGNNLYQIQMKTQLQYPANINMARLRIKTNY